MMTAFGDSSLVVRAIRQGAYNYLDKPFSLDVAPGETLWTVAAAVAGSRSVSAVVDDIVLVNHLSSSDVAAGTRLLVPIK